MAPAIFESTLLERSLRTKSLSTFDVFETENAIKGWPKQLDSEPLAWKATDYSGDHQYFLNLMPSEIEEIDAALKNFNDSGLDGHLVNKHNFPLPTMGPKLENFSRDLHLRTGFFVVRGIELDKYSTEDNMTIFLGLSSFVGEERAQQDRAGNMIIHIRNMKCMNLTEAQKPNKYSRQASKFHTDSHCDILALQLRSNAHEGGDHMIVSSWTLYNRLAKEKPDVLAVLARPDWPHTICVPQNGGVYRPLVSYQDGKIIWMFHEPSLKGVPGAEIRSYGLPHLTAEQNDALDVVQEIARQEHLKLSLQPGDMAFLNNRAILHGREEYVNTSDASRYLVRLWLKNRRWSWKLPPHLELGNTCVYFEREVDEQWNVEQEGLLSLTLVERLST